MTLRFKKEKCNKEIVDLINKKENRFAILLSACRQTLAFFVSPVRWYSRMSNSLRASARPS